MTTKNEPTFTLAEVRMIANAIHCAEDLEFDDDGNILKAKWPVDWWSWDEGEAEIFTRAFGGRIITRSTAWAKE